MSNFSLKDNVGLIVVLRVRPQGSDAPSSSQDLPVIAIANTHLIFNPKRGDIKVSPNTGFKGIMPWLKNSRLRLGSPGITFCATEADFFML